MTDGEWKQICMVLIDKYVPHGGCAVIKHSDIERLADRFDPGRPVLYTKDRPDGFELSIVSESAAIVLNRHKP